MMAKRRTRELPAVHPSEVLREEIETRGMTAALLARDIDVPQNRISEIVAGRRNVTPDTAYRLSLYLGTSAEFWLNLQARYDLEMLIREEGKAIAARVRPPSGN
jgi:antitoxin HigA-1